LVSTADRRLPTADCLYTFFTRDLLALCKYPRMAKRIRTLYKWDDGKLHRVGSISEARLWAWEYREVAEAGWEFEAGDFHDTVRVWTTARPDLGPEQLFIGSNLTASP
jgi:hypothetical protein